VIANKTEPAVILFIPAPSSAMNSIEVTTE